MMQPSQALRIIEADEVNDELFIACLRLVPQLSSSEPPPSRDLLQRLIASEASTLFLAMDQQDRNATIVGLATLVLYRVPTGLRGYIEDVVVDRSQRGRGIGEALVNSCLVKAKRCGCPQVMLTCNPARTSANRLYRRMGFELRKTNVYTYWLSQNPDQDQPGPGKSSPPNI